MGHNYCPNCGNKLEPGDIFCTHCGYRLVPEEKEKSVVGREKTKVIKGNDSKKEKNNKPKAKRKETFKASQKDQSSTTEDNHPTPSKSDNSIESDKNRRLFWSIFAIAIVIIAFIVHANTLPKGYSKPYDVLKYSMQRNYMLNINQGMVDGHERLEDIYGAYGFFSDDDSDTDKIQVLRNKKTKRFVFWYKYKGHKLPCYVVVMTTNNYNYLYITPVNKKSVASIFKEQVTQDYIDEHFNSDYYYGYSLDDISDLGITYNKQSIHESAEHNDTIIYTYKDN